MCLKVIASVFQEYFSDLHMSAEENEDEEQNGMDYKVCYLVSLFMISINKPVVV